MTGGKRTSSNWRAILVVSGVIAVQAAAAQSVTPAETALSKARALEARLPAPKAVPKVSYDLSPARQERFQKYLPKAWRTLSQRESFHILVVGDPAALEVWTEDSLDREQAGSFADLFAHEIAAQFFYSGGVRRIGGGAARGTPLLGPAISLRTLGRADGSVLDAASILMSSARQSPVNLVILCYGGSEGASGMSPVTFTRAMGAALDAVKDLGAEAVVCGPWLPMAKSAETSLGSTRPLTDALRETAAAENILFADLGDLASTLRVTEIQASDEGHVFEGIERSYRALFHEGAGGEFVPRPALHVALGSLLFRTLLDGPAGVAWSVKDASATLTEQDRLSLSFTLHNASKSRLGLTLLPLIAAGWKPLETTPQLSLPAGTLQSVVVKYARQSADAAPLQEAVARLPMLVVGGALARIEDLRAPVRPLAVVWSLETLFNQETSFSAGCQIVNRGATPAKGTWEAEFQGKKLQGSFDVKPEGVFPLDLRFDLPAEGPAVHVAPLKLLVKSDAGEQRSERQVTLTHNLGLGQSVPLTAVGEKKPAGVVTLKAGADKGLLSFTCELNGAELLQDAPTAAWQIEVNVDARSYGKRLLAGATTAVRAAGTALDGAGSVQEVSPWAFGNGYSAAFDARQFKAALSSTAMGTRQIALTIPRSYLYLHEWALDNGNSQFGVNVRLTLYTSAGYVTYTLAPTTKPADDVEALAVLELSTKPTARVTVDLH